MMDQTKPRLSFWNPLYIGVISYFCLLVPGLVLMWMNFRRMGLTQKARYTAIIGVPMLLAVLAIYIWVPKEYDDWVGALHISLAIVIGAIPYRDYRRLMDENPQQKPALLIKPALFSILFPLGLLAAWYGYARFQEEHRIEMLTASMDAYQKNDFRNALNLLNDVKEDFPEERLAFVNSAIVYEALQKPDSAALSIEQWLKIAPNDEEAKEMLERFRYASSNR
jgi:tetratricopeptide (TPR) repeat protein